jgi:RNA polymerase sigma-70 factor (ECF subfamily)
VSGESAAQAASGDDLLALYDRALPDVYGYLVSRCGSAAVAEDLTSETFMAAVDAVRRAAVPQLTTAWLVGVARHKLVDHWRRKSREERTLALVDTDELRDDWDAELDAVRAHTVLAQLDGNHRSVLTLRYLDGLPVAAVAECVGRTVHATEALLVRARRAFRRAYGEEDSDAG